jgi:hypothetical protein
MTAKEQNIAKANSGSLATSDQLLGLFLFNSPQD